MKDNFKDKIFSKIKEDKIEPIPESYFENKYKFIWIFIWLIALLGIIFWGFLIDNSSEFFWMWWYRRWYMNYFIFPNIFWIALIFFLTFIWIKSLKGTPVWYRHSYIKDILIWIAIIFIGSYIFRFLWLWTTMHSLFINNIPGVSNILYNESSWNDPNNWRLAWTIIDINNEMIKLKSIDWMIWSVNIKNSFLSQSVSLRVDEKVRVLWNISSTWAFESERIMPWFWMWMWGWRGMMWWEWFWNWRWMMR